MNRYRLLKLARIGQHNAPYRGLSDPAIDIRLLQLLSARYI